jgi:Spy/CpxP family protein refolding chaperone
MKTALAGLLFTAVLFILPASLTAQPQDMMDRDGMQSMMEDHGGMMGGMGMDGMGPGMMDGSGRGGMGMGGCGMGPGGGMGPAMMDGPGRSGMMGLGPIEKLDLTPDQRSKLNKIEYDLRKQHWSLMGKVIDEKAKLYDLYAADKPDPKKLGAVYGAIFDVRRQMIEAGIDAMNRARDILTKDQITRLKQLQQHGGGAADGMHHEMMHEMMHGSGAGTAK